VGNWKRFKRGDLHEKSFCSKQQKCSIGGNNICGIEILKLCCVWLYYRQIYRNLQLMHFQVVHIHVEEHKYVTNCAKWMCDCCFIPKGDITC
jgi:hypothetical protein